MIPVMIDLALAEIRSVVVSSLKQLIAEVVTLFKGSTEDCIEYSVKYLKVVVKKALKKFLKTPQGQQILASWSAA